MPTLKNISPLGDLDVVLVGRTVAAGEEFDVSDEHAKWLLEQAESFELAKSKPTPKNGDV